MNLIDRIKELQKLEASMFPGNYKVINGSGLDNYIVAGDRTIATVSKQQYTGKTGKEIWPTFKNVEGFTELRNAAPELLSILVEIRPGDAKILSDILDAWKAESEGGDDWDDAIDCLRRYQAMATRMEAECPE